jgi:hypothetical protein
MWYTYKVCVSLYMSGGGGILLNSEVRMSLAMKINCPTGSRISIPGRAQTALFSATYIVLRLSFINTKFGIP